MDRGQGQSATGRGGNGGRPNVFSYHDYRLFLRDWVTFKKEQEPEYSIRRLAQRAGMASGYLPPVIAKQRHLSHEALVKLVAVLEFSPEEQAYFEDLVKLTISSSHEARSHALHRLKGSAPYRKKNPGEAEFIEYMSHWHYIAIREMAALGGFKNDLSWIQKRLKNWMSRAEIKKALKFLVKKGYIKLTDEGAVASVKEHLHCAGGVYTAALSTYHREMFELAMRSIDNSTPQERSLLGHTVAIPADEYPQAEAILREALGKIQALGQQDRPADTVYHVELAMFPMTKGGRA